MLGTIKKISETTIKGGNRSFSMINTQLPCAKPIKDLGLLFGILHGVDGPYKLVRGDNEPYHTNLLYIIEGNVELETSVGDFELSPGSFVHMPSNISRRIELVNSPRYIELMFKLFNNAI